MKKLMGLALAGSVMFFFVMSLPLYNNAKDVKAITTTLSSYSESNKIELIDRNMKEENDFMDINLSFPRIQDLTNKNFQDNINKEIEDYINSIRIEVKNKFEKDYSYANVKGYKIPKYELKSNYKITYIDENILSFTITTYKYTGGTYGITNKKSYNIDLKSERILQLQDLFTEDEDFQSVINKKISEDMAKNKSLYYNNKFHSINYDQQFYLQGEEIIIYFPMNEISVYTLGILEFQIPFTNFYNGVHIKNADRSKIPQITTTNTVKHNRYININVKSPKIHVSNKSFNNKINEYVESSVWNFVESLENEAKNTENRASKNNELFIPYSVNISYTILQNNKWNIIVALVKSHFDGNSFKTTNNIINIDLKTGEISEQ